MEASSSQFPSSRTRKRTSGGDGDNTRTVVVTKNLDEGRLKARERQRRKRERDRAGRDKSSVSSRKIVGSSEQEKGEGADSIANNGIVNMAYLKAEEQRRLKARERQRRKREHDRSLRRLSVDGSRADVEGLLSPQNGEITSHAPDIVPIPITSPDGVNANPSDVQEKEGQLSQTVDSKERAKKEKIRQGARERQRKHRALVKARRMAETDMAGDGDGDVEQSVMDEHEHHEPVSIPHPYLLHPDLHITSEASFPFPVPQPYMTLGQTFAQILLLSISHTPTLKQELLQSLRMSEEDLISLMPMIASAWDQWNYDRSLHHSTNASSEDHTAGSTSDIPPPNANVNPDQDATILDQNQSAEAEVEAEAEAEAEVEADAEAGQSPELSNLSSADFPETPLVSIIYHMKNRLGQLFTRENRNRH